MIHKLINTEKLNKEEIAELINKGAKFILFKYNVALVATTFTRVSPAILITSANQLKKHKRKYNLYSLFFGPWFIPTGPFNVYNTIKLNNSGGIDVTKDIEINLEHYNPLEKTIEIKNIDTEFAHISKGELRELHKALKNYSPDNLSMESIYVGKFINVEEYVEPHYVVGFKAELEENHIEEIFACIYTRFRSYVPFEIIDQNSDLFKKLERQGQKVI